MAYYILSEVGHYESKAGLKPGAVFLCQPHKYISHKCVCLWGLLCLYNLRRSEKLCLVQYDSLVTTRFRIKT